MDKGLNIFKHLSIAALFAISLSGCDYQGENSSTSSSETQSASTQTQTQTQPITTPKSIPTYNPPTFHGNTCTSDCSGHEAGYEWAEENGISDPSDCGGNSTSFIEGCESYAEENGSYLDDEEYEEDYDYDY